MPKKKNPGSAGTLQGTGKHTPAVSGGACPPDIEWDACRKAQDAAAERKARDAARVKAAARALGRFKQKPSGLWMYECPDCQAQVVLEVTVDGDVRASIFGSKACPTALSIQQWLRGNGFES
jgi:hypothetical protein